MLTVALAAALLPGMPALAAPARHTPALPRDRSTPVHAVTNHYRKPTPMPRWQATLPVWPSGAADVTFTTSSARSSTSTAGQATRAGTLPVWVSAAAPADPTGKQSSTPVTPRSVHVQVASRAAATAAGVDGVLMSVNQKDGATATRAVHVSLSYASFADAYGGDWASRLRLSAVPACALTTPAAASCRSRTPIAFTNDATARTLSADVTLPAAATAAGPASTAAVVLAAVSADAGGAGDFSATSLKASGSWQAGGSSDGFTWSYPIVTPDVPGGLAPPVTLAYSSQSVDGSTSSSNNQASWIGDGWEYSPGFIERSYQSCHQNPAGATKTWDTCWSANNQLTLSLNGSSTLLIRDDGDSSGSYHAQDDSNEKVQYLTGATNGAKNGEYFQLTTPDGTRYIFGLNRLPGWASGNAETNSVSTEPVFFTSDPSGSDHALSCYNATWANSWCQEAYRWSLDEVIDPHDDSIGYFYQTQTGYYARNLGAKADTSYIRGGYLQKITYGQRVGSQYSTSPAAQVIFNVNGRCATSSMGCAASSLSSSTASNWPDVPQDLNCVNGASCPAQSPVFWSEYMLTGIQTQALVDSTETNVDSWALNHSFPATGETSDKPQTSPALWLDSITRTGQDTTAGGSTSGIPLNPVVFTGTPLANRVNLVSGYPAITRRRLNTITTETGETISVDYSQAICSTCTPSDASTNTTLSYPVYWTRPGQVDPSIDWFNKYLVTHVTQQDGTGQAGGATGGAPPGANDTIVTTYTPVGTPAWHYNDNPLTPSNQRSWDQWRGYQGMTVTTGTSPDPVTKTTYAYFRGMDGDTLPNNGIRHVTVADSRGDPAVTDADQYAGNTYEVAVFNSSSLVTDTVTDPWSSAATATHALSGGLPAQHAFHTGDSASTVYTPLTSGAVRQTRTQTTHDSYGRVTRVNDQGDTSSTADDLCTTTSFADNTGAWMLNRPAEVKTISVDCATSSPPTSATVADQLSFYDGSTTLGAAPTHGDATMGQQLQSYTGSTANYLTVKTVTVDQYGRPLTETDANNHTTTTAYTPAAGATPTSVKVTDPLKLSTTTSYDPLRNLPTKVTDPATYVASKQYDALGRLTAVYKPGRATSSAPNLKYSYNLANTAPSVVDTYTLNEDGSTFRVSRTLYDSLLRAREVQTQTPDGGRVITDTNYNTDGWPSMTTDPYFNSGAVSTTYVEAAAGNVDSETGYLYDGVGRRTTVVAYHLGTETWRTSYLYGGNFTTTIPPAGATPTTTVTDARNRQTHLIGYHAGMPTDYLTDPPSDYTDTTFGYTPAGQPATEKDAAGNVWAWSYDLFGHQSDAYDPDSGHTRSTYDNAGHLTSVTNLSDGNKQTTYSYDADDRKTGVYDTTGNTSPSSANQIAGWTYDTVKSGRLTSTVTHSAGDVYTSTVRGYNGYGLPAAVLITLTGTDAAFIPSAGYTISYGYSPTGRPTGHQDPAMGGLPQENVITGYDNFGEPTSLGSTGGASWSYASAVGYNEYGQPLRYTMPTVAGNVWVDLSYDPQTRALATIRTTDSTTSGDVDNLTYTYGSDSVSKGTGLVTRIVDKRNAASLVDTQCFSYDDAMRLSQAWTATDNCAATPQPGSPTTVGGTFAPYWQSWTYDPGSGLRTAQTDHDVSGTTANDTTTTYHYPATSTNPQTPTQPHTLSGTTATGPNATTNTATYTYDPSGDTTRITGGATGSQQLTWTNQGKLATDQTSTGTTSYVYDADGNLLARRNPGSTTLYLGDAQLVRDSSSGAITGTRYYTLGGATIAARNSTGSVACLVPDRQGTDQLSITTDTSQTITRRQYLPFGQARGAAGIFAGDKGYIGGDTDTTTSLTNLGAREYNPATGRFLSLDPVFEATDPNQVNGYDYAANNPVTHADPTGLRPAPEDGINYRNDGSVIVPTGPGDQGCTSGPECDSGGGTPAPHTRNPHKTKAVPIATYYPHGVWSFTTPDGRMIVNGVDVTNIINSYKHPPTLDEFASGLDNYWTDHAKDWPIPLNVAVAIQFAMSNNYIPGKADPTVHLALLDAQGVDLSGPMPDEHVDPPAFIPELRRCGDSFDPDTPVLMNNGDTKAIKDIKVGDQVAAGDPHSGTDTGQLVTQLHDHQDTKLTDLTITTPDGLAVIHTTQNHTFWDVTAKEWVPAGHLPIDATLYASTRSLAQVIAVRNWTGSRDMRNLTVSRFHTYYVLAGSVAVLVHNDDTPIDLNGKSYTIWQRGPYRIDIEARSGTKQMHFQVQIQGVGSGDAPKYQYNPGTGQFDGMPKWLQRDLAKNYPDYQKGLSKGADVFDRVIGTCG